MADLLQGDGPPQAHRHVPYVLLAKLPELTARVRLHVRIVEKPHQMALCRQVQLHRRLDAYRQHVLFQQERGNIEGEWREVPVVTAQQPAVQPDVGHQECAVETQEGALAVPWPGKTDAIPDRLVAAGGAV